MLVLMSASEVRATDTTLEPVETPSINPKAETVASAVTVDAKVKSAD
jgi:hypothetical protein